MMASCSRLLSSLELLVYCAGSRDKLGVQLAHGEQRILAGAAPGGRHRQQVQGGGAILADMVGVGEVAVERDARRGEIVEELDDEAHRVLVEVRLQHAVAQDRDDGGLAGDVRLETVVAAHRRLRGGRR